MQVDSSDTGDLLDSDAFQPFVLKQKGKTPVREGRSSAFTKPTPYTRPPSSLASSSKSRISPSVSSTRMGSSTRSAKNHMSAKLESLDKQSEALLDSEGRQGSSRAAMRYNYAIRKQELDNQHEEHVAKVANAPAEFERTQKLKMLDIQLLEQEERTTARQIELLRLQYALRQPHNSLTPMPPGPGPSFPSRSSFPSSSLLPGHSGSSSPSSSLFPLAAGDPSYLANDSSFTLAPAPHFIPATPCFPPAAPSFAPATLRSPPATPRFPPAAPLSLPLLNFPSRSHSPTVAHTVIAAVPQS